MAVAVAQVKQIITIQGVDNASAVVAKAQGSLKGLEAQADKTSKATARIGDSAKSLKEVQEKSGDLESALKGVKDFAGGIAPEVSAVGDAFGGVEAVMRLLPGPMGLVATGVVAAAAGAAALFQHLDKVAAKARLLVSAEGGALAKSLNLDTDAAVQLSTALQTLGKDGIRPADALIREVAANAKALGIEPAEAVAKFIAAWKEGPEAIAKVQQEIGKIVTLQSVPQVARSLGLDPTTLGLTATVSTTDRLKKGLEELAKLRANAAAAEAQSVVLQGQASKATSVQSIELAKQAAAQADSAAEIRRQIVSEEQAARFRGKKVEAEKAFAEVSKEVADTRAQFDAQAEQARTKAIGQGVRLEGLDRAQGLLTKQIAVQQDLVARGTGKEAADRLASLKLQSAQIDIARKQLIMQDQAEQKAKAKESADKARATAAAAIDAALRLRKARADADGIQTERERIDLIDAEAAKERAAVTASTATAKVKALQLQAIDQETANKRRSLGAELGEVERKNADELTKFLVGQAKRETAIQAQLLDAQAGNAKANTATMAQRLRDLGDVDSAVLVERRQAMADYAAEVSRINKEIADSQAELNTLGEEFANLDLLRDERLIAAKRTLAEQQRRLDAETSQRFREGIALAAEAVKGPADLIGRLGEENQKLAAGLNTAADAIANVSRNWKGLKQSAPDAISAAGAVASAFVDNEKDKAAILAVTELAASIASYAAQDYVGAAAHAASAALYAGVAGGVIGSSSSGASGGGGSPGGFSGPAAPATTGTPTVQQQSAVVINFNQPLVTKQEIGKAITGALRSVGNTGMAKAKGV